MALFKNKPMEVESVQWLAENVEEMDSFLQGQEHVCFSRVGDALILAQVEGDNYSMVPEGHWIIKTANGICVLDDEMFCRRFEPASRLICLRN